MRTQLGCMALAALALQSSSLSMTPTHGDGDAMVLAATAYSIPAPLMCEQRSEEELLEEILAGLRQRPKRVAPVRLHDERSAALYDRLCGAPEYYLARTELALIDEYAQQIATRIGPDAALIEFGAATGLKARVLLDEMENPVAYVPVDVARTPLIAAARTLAARFPSLAVMPVCADFTRAFVMPREIEGIDRRVVYLSGAMLNRFHPDEAAEVLQLMHLVAGMDGAVLISLDLEQDAERLERAYNDSAGVGAELNRNVLRHLNHRFDGNFDLRRFLHRAVWVEDEGRVDLGLVSQCDQAVALGNAEIAFAEGEELLTGSAFRYSPEMLAEIAGEAGLGLRSAWADDESSFSLQLLEPTNQGTSGQAPGVSEAGLLLPGRLGNAPAF